MYTGTLAFLLEAHGVGYHFFADDTQLYIRVEDIDEAKHRLSSLMSDLKIWMTRRKLKLNDGKTEIIVIRGNLRNVSVANFGEMSFGNTQLVPCESAKNLGVVLDSSLSFRSHIDSIVKTSNFHLFRQILTFRIKEHISPAKVGTGCLELKLPAEWGNPPPPTPQAQKAQLSFFAQPSYGVHLSRNGGLLDLDYLCFSSVDVSGLSSGTNNAGL